MAKAIVFNGKRFVEEKVVALRVKALGTGTTPKLASILASNDKASRLYVNLKKKFAQRVGCKVEVYKVHDRKGADHIVRLIDYLNRDKETHGIMIQLPLPDRLKEYQSRIINTIAPQKDVDGLRKDSPFVHPTARAVEMIINEARRAVKIRKSSKVVVIGYQGQAGGAIFRHLKGQGFEVVGAGRGNRSKPEFSKFLAKKKFKAKVVISATGDSGFVGSQHVSDGAAVIDVGSPKGDVDPAVAKKASFITPVPGGVGPVTVYCLLENLVEAGYN
jgi:methylenetetrahydrofolate dehydrogenase (NADP+)/methenyltetrahydrofolate cyclohydrolase